MHTHTHTHTFSIPGWKSTLTSSSTYTAPCSTYERYEKIKCNYQKTNKSGLSRALFVLLCIRFSTSPIPSMHSNRNLMTSSTSRKSNFYFLASSSHAKNLNSSLLFTYFLRPLCYVHLVLQYAVHQEPLFSAFNFHPQKLTFSLLSSLPLAALGALSCVSFADNVW